MNSEFICGRVSKLLLEVAIDLELNLIVKTSILLWWMCFPLQVFTLKRFVLLVLLGHHIVVFFIFCCFA